MHQGQLLPQGDGLCMPVQGGAQKPPQGLHRGGDCPVARKPRPAVDALQHVVEEVGVDLRLQGLELRLLGQQLAHVALLHQGADLLRHVVEVAVEHGDFILGSAAQGGGLVAGIRHLPLEAADLGQQCLQPIGDGADDGPRQQAGKHHGAAQDQDEQPVGARLGPPLLLIGHQQRVAPVSHARQVAVGHEVMPVREGQDTGRSVDVPGDGRQRVLLKGGAVVEALAPVVDDPVEVIQHGGAVGGLLHQAVHVQGKEHHTGGGQVEGADLPHGSGSDELALPAQPRVEQQLTAPLPGLKGQRVQDGLLVRAGQGVGGGHGVGAGHQAHVLQAQLAVFLLQADQPLVDGMVGGQLGLLAVRGGNPRQLPLDGGVAEDLVGQGVHLVQAFAQLGGHQLQRAQGGLGQQVVIAIDGQQPEQAGHADNEQLRPHRQEHDLAAQLHMGYTAPFHDCIRPLCARRFLCQQFI